jgi:molecular chaperone DnaK
MVREAGEHEAEDKKRREEIEARNRLDALCYTTQKTLDDNRDKIAEGDRAELEEALKDGRSALDKGDGEALRMATEKLQKAAHKVAEAMYRTAAAGAPSDEPGGKSKAGGNGKKSDGGPRRDGVIDAEFKEGEG